ncbi:MAG: nucleotidyltransferase family protein [Solobacterium sp.]|nr:nucleotidyltransferase family protein [Solobacterium sp.]
MNEREQKVLRFLFVDDQNEEEIRAVLEGIDPDEEDITFLLLLAILGYHCAWKGYPEEIIPRLKGIHRYHQVDNAMKFTWLSGILKELESAGITPMMIKGGAMYMHYMQSSPRVMSDYDVAVPADRFDEAYALLESLGCVKGNTAAWAVGFRTQVYGRTACLDLHSRMFKNAETADDLVRERAVPVRFRGVEALVPCAEDMFVHLMDNQIRNYFHNEYAGRRTKWFFDCLCLLQSYPELLDPAKLQEQVSRFCDRKYILLALRMFSYWFPEVVSRETVESCFPVNEAYWEWLSAGMEYRKCYIAVAGFDQGGKLPPKRLYLSTKRWLTEYRFMGPEFREQYGKMSFIDFFCHQTGCRNAADAFRRYLPRLRLKG